MYMIGKIKMERSDESISASVQSEKVGKYLNNNIIKVSPIKIDAAIRKNIFFSVSMKRSILINAFLYIEVFDNRYC